MPIFNVNTEAPPRKLPVLDASYPQDVTLVASAGGSATFKVAIAEDGKPAEYSYQWYVNGTAVSGATGASYTRTGLTAKATYTVYCAVTNKAGTVNSRAATLTVKSYLPEFTYTGSCKLVDEGNYKWKVYFYTSGILRFTSLGSAENGGIDVFAVGGGASGSIGSSKSTGTGGGGGYTTTKKAVSISTNTNYAITIGAGGATNTSNRVGLNGGTTTAFGVSADGGKGGNDYAARGGDGGSGGGGGYNSTIDGNGDPGEGGSDGSNGKGNGGTGQGSTTREFGESGATLYAGGGGGGPKNAGGAGGGGAAVRNGVSQAGTTNLGGGGGAGSYSNDNASYGWGGAGGSGIVVVRNKR